MKTQPDPEGMRGSFARGQGLDDSYAEPGDMKPEDEGLDGALGEADRGGGSEPRLQPARTRSATEATTRLPVTSPPSFRNAPHVA